MFSVWIWKRRWTSRMRGPIPCNGLSGGSLVACSNMRPRGLVEHCSRLPRKSHVRLLAWMAALVKDGWLDMRSTGQGGSNKPWHPGIPQRLRLSCQKKALGLIDNEMLTLALELSNIELFKYCTKKSHSIKCYYKHANELTQMFISGSDWMIVLKSLLNKTCLKKIK